MRDFNRRAFLGVTAGLFTAGLQQTSALAQACVTGPFPSFLPNRLTVDCASRRNFQAFRSNSDYLGLAGAVSMTFVRGKLGTYEAGNLFLFPWLKPKGLALGAGRVWPVVAPAGATNVVQASPLSGSTLPVDELFCISVLQAPTNAFIGFRADAPFDPLSAKLGLYTNVGKLADGKGIGIDWASSNLNHLWFGGSRAIPNTTPCYGSFWRKLIMDGLNQAAAGTGTCAV
jgi:hypothetical protein